VTTFRFHLLCGLACFILMARAFAKSPATNSPPGPGQIAAPTHAEPATPAPNGTSPSEKSVAKAPNTSQKKDKSSSAAAPAPQTASAPPAKGAPAAPAKSVSVLDHYLQDLNDSLKLSAQEKADIQTYYLADGIQLHDILNDSSLSPLQQAQQVSDLRDKRNDKIEALLSDVDRRRDFFAIEANYRVALTEAAANGALIPAQMPPPQ
jgi:hypothetical protein